MIEDDYKGKLLHTYRPLLKMTLLANFFCAVLPLAFEVKIFFLQTNTLQLLYRLQLQDSQVHVSMGCELLIYILHNVFALQADGIIKILREYKGLSNNNMREVAGSLDGMYRPASLSDEFFFSRLES